MNCGQCHQCVNASEDPFRRRFVVCSQCGNKRCPKATYHRNECTGSNEPGQPGSDWESVENPNATTHPRTTASVDYAVALGRVRYLVTQLGPAMADPERAIELIDECGQELQVMMGAAHVLGQKKETER